MAFVYGWYGFAQFGYNVVLTGTLDILFGIAGFNIIPLYYAIKYNVKICDWLTTNSVNIYRLVSKPRKCSHQLKFSLFSEKDNKTVESNLPNVASIYIYNWAVSVC